ncbi:MAG: hemerythrin domain-containing protein [Anaerolineaceae bacterium]
MGKATQDLLNEHDAILHVFSILDKMLTSSKFDEERDLNFADELVHFLKVFADQCHHGKEEGFLFKELENRGVPNQGGPISVMLQEHMLGRQLIAKMSEAVQDADLEAFKLHAVEYRDLLRQHIQKENAVLFKLADQLISDEEQMELFEKFEAYEENVIGHGVHEQLHAQIHAWEILYRS